MRQTLIVEQNPDAAPGMKLGAELGTVEVAFEAVDVEAAGNPLWTEVELDTELEAAVEVALETVGVEAADKPVWTKTKFEAAVELALEAVDAEAAGKPLWTEVELDIEVRAAAEADFETVDVEVADKPVWTKPELEAAVEEALETIDVETVGKVDWGGTLLCDRLVTIESCVEIDGGSWYKGTSTQLPVLGPQFWPALQYQLPFFGSAGTHGMSALKTAPEAKG